MPAQRRFATAVSPFGWDPRASELDPGVGHPGRQRFGSPVPAGHILASLDVVEYKGDFRTMELSPVQNRCLPSKPVQARRGLTMAR